MKFNTENCSLIGASAGDGRACAKAFAEIGSDVALLARSKDELERAKKEVESLGR